MMAYRASGVSRPDRDALSMVTVPLLGYRDTWPSSRTALDSVVVMGGVY